MSETSGKPPIPTNPADPFPRIPVDDGDGSPFDRLLQLALFCADHWTFGADGPYEKPLTGADRTRGQMREGLLHLLELGLIDIDEERLNTESFWPSSREPDPVPLPLGEEQP